MGHGTSCLNAFEWLHISVGWGTEVARVIEFYFSVLQYLPYTQAMHATSQAAASIKESPEQYQSTNATQYIPL